MGAARNRHLASSKGAKQPVREAGGCKRAGFAWITALMIIVLNGYPGTGKLTIGRHLADRLQGRLVDIHTIYNLAFALTAFKSEAFYRTIRAVQALADDLILELPPDVPVIFTEILTHGSDWGDEAHGRLLDLAKARGPLCMVELHCDLTENERRIQHPDRELSRKPRDPGMARRNHERAAVLMGADLPDYLRLDVTHMTAEGASAAIANWAAKRGSG